jgi:hypothetical protein
VASPDHTPPTRKTPRPIWTLGYPQDQKTNREGCGPHCVTSLMAHCLKASLPLPVPEVHLGGRQGVQAAEGRKAPWVRPDESPSGILIRSMKQRSAGAPAASSPRGSIAYGLSAFWPYPLG